MGLVVAFSGGKDSTAMACRMAELGEKFVLLFTPTKNELPEVAKHVESTAKMLDRELVLPPGGQTLEFWMNEYNALPNWRQRWCTRLIKIQPCIAYLVQNPGSTLCVGLRADEEERQGLYGPYAEYRYPLREWGWGLKEVWAYLGTQCVTVPERTDCALCYDQRISEWWALWNKNPDEYAKGEAWEERTGFTFRSPARDTWPAKLSELRAEFEKGRTPRGVREPTLFDDRSQCRVCRF